MKHPLQPHGDEPPKVQTIQSTLIYPMTSMPNLKTPKEGGRKENARKIDINDLNVSIPDLDKLEQQKETKLQNTGRLFSDESLKNDSGLLELSREVGRQSSIVNTPTSVQGHSFSPIQVIDFAAPPKAIKKPLTYRVNSKKRDKRRSKDIPQPPRTPPRIPLPTPPRKKSIPPSRIPRLAGPPIRKKIPSKLKQRLSKDLESARNSDNSNEEQTYTEVLALLSDVVADAVDDDIDISRHIEAIRQSLTDQTLSDRDAKSQLKQLSRAARQSKHASRAMLNIYSALSTLPTDAALSMIDEVLENPTRAPSQKSTIASRNRNSRSSRGSRASSGKKRSRNNMLSEFDSELGQKLSEKLAQYADPNEVVVYDDLLVPKMERSHSGSSMRILENLDIEVDLKLRATRQRQRHSPDSSTRSSIVFDDNIRIAEKASLSPLWMPSPKVWGQAESSTSPHVAVRKEKIVQPKVPGPTTLNEYVTEDDVISPTESGLTGSPGPQWLTLSFDEPSPLAELTFPGEPSKTSTPKVPVRKALPVRSASSQNIKLLSKQAGLWRPVPPPKPTQTYGLWDAPQEPAKVTKRHQLLDFSSGPDSPTKPHSPPPVPKIEVSQNNEYGSSGLWKPSIQVDQPSDGLLWQQSQKAETKANVNRRSRSLGSQEDRNIQINPSDDPANTSEKEATLWQPHLYQSASIAASPIGLWRKDTRVTIRYQRTHRQWPYIGSIRYPRHGQPSEYRSQSVFEDRDGLWQKPDPTDKVTPSMWISQRRSEFIPRDSELPSVSLKDGTFLDEVNFLLDSRFSSPIVFPQQLCF